MLLLPPGAKDETSDADGEFGIEDLGVKSSGVTLKGSKFEILLKGLRFGGLGSWRNKLRWKMPQH